MSSNVEFLALGGLKEVGKNCLLIKYEDQAIMVDCGMGFPGNDDFMEDDFFIPDFDIINELDIELLGCVITHGHEDHIGGVPYLLQKFNVPVYMTKFPKMILEERIGRYAKYKNRIESFSSKKTPEINLGPFRVEMFDVPHSIPEAKGLIIDVGGITIVHTGDFKYDGKKGSPFKGRVPKKVDVLLSDSTNIENTGHSESESSIIPNITQIIENAPGRVIATGFSSNTTRIKNIIDISLSKGRTVGLLGRSVCSYTRIASELGHLKLPASLLTEQTKINRVPENKLTLIVTGSQAEPRSVMKRMSLDMMKSVSVKFGDTIFFTSKNIPGNELSIGRMIDNLVEKGADVYYENTDDIHVSGHAKQFDIVQCFKDVNPDLIIPVHGHRRFLELSAKLTERNGFNAQMITDGEMLSLRKNKRPVISHKYDLTVKVVSNGDPDLVDIENIRERKKIAKAGIMTVMMTVDFLANSLLSKPRIVSSGIASVPKMKKIEREVKDIIDNYFKDELADEPFWKDVEEEIRIRVRRHLFAITRKKPIVNAIIVNLD